MIYTNTLYRKKAESLLSGIMIAKTGRLKEVVYEDGEAYLEEATEYEKKRWPYPLNKKFVEWLKKKLLYQQKVKEIGPTFFQHFPPTSPQPCQQKRKSKKSSVKKERANTLMNETGEITPNPTTTSTTQPNKKAGLHKKVTKERGTHTKSQTKRRNNLPLSFTSQTLNKLLGQRRVCYTGYNNNQPILLPKGLRYNYGAPYPIYEGKISNKIQGYIDALFTDKQSITYQNFKATIEAFGGAVDERRGSSHVLLLGREDRNGLRRKLFSVCKPHGQSGAKYPKPLEKYLRIAFLHFGARPRIH